MIVMRFQVDDVVYVPTKGCGRIVKVYSGTQRYRTSVDDRIRDEKHVYASRLEFLEKSLAHARRVIEEAKSDEDILAQAYQEEKDRDTYKKFSDETIICLRYR